MKCYKLSAGGSVCMGLVSFTTSSAATPTRSGMRAVSTKREFTGRGVFLPRQTRAPTKPSKKHEIMYRQSVMMARQRQKPTQVSEFSLPQEWTY
ncbi:hypothetical protein Hanom_Chr05g00468541 [Helianthus anomalus]